MLLFSLSGSPFENFSTFSRNFPKVSRYMPPNKKKMKLVMNEVVMATFPTLIQLFQKLQPLATLESAEMQLLLVKIFWSIINVCQSIVLKFQFGIPSLLMDNNNLLPWMNCMLHLQQVSHTIYNFLHSY
jgi:hypothetical protein